MRLIDADYLKNLPFERLIHTDFGDTAIPIEEIDNAPTVERPTGEWIEVEPTEEDIENGFDTRIVCSRCYKPDRHYDYDEYYKPKAVWYFRPDFCPNCGADMRVKDELNELKEGEDEENDL